jgi:hypothetical protein
MQHCRVGLGFAIFFEGWLGVLYRHRLGENLGTSIITSMFALVVNKVGRLTPQVYGDCFGT